MSAGLQWMCDKCGEPIANNGGYLHLPVGKCADRADDMARWDRIHVGTMFSLSELGSRPVRVTWEAHHRRCDPRPHAYDYWIGVERARTYEQLLDWTLHLEEKTWYRASNWGSFLRMHLAGKLTSA